MTLLLDTHLFLWWRANDPRVAPVRRSISTARTVLVSAASAWEAAIKQSSGKLRLEDPFEWMVEDSGFSGLPVTLSHAAQVVTLPGHHRDPFDRMLIAQATREGATIVTHDPLFRPYDVSDYLGVGVLRDRHYASSRSPIGDRLPGFPFSRDTGRAGR